MDGDKSSLAFRVQFFYSARRFHNGPI